MGSPQTVEVYVGEDVQVTVTFADDITAAAFSFVIAPTLQDALEGTNAIVSTSASIDSSTQATIDLTDGTSSGMAAGGSYFVLRRTDDTFNTVAAWGPWVVVGA